MNHSREYWYMGSMLARLVTQKKRICVFTATGMYLLRVVSISRSVCSAAAILVCRDNSELMYEGRYIQHSTYYCSCVLTVQMMGSVGSQRKRKQTRFVQ